MMARHAAGLKVGFIVRGIRPCYLRVDHHHDYRETAVNCAVCVSSQLFLFFNSDIFNIRVE